MGLMLKTGFSHESTVNESKRWFTPEWIFKDIITEQIDLDPCTEQGGIPWINATKIHTEHEDGLIQPWEGFVFMNPPYGKDTKVWLKKLHEHGDGIGLVFARCDNSWFHDYVAKADAILFLRGRLKFVSGEGKEGSSAPAGSLLVGYVEKAIRMLTNAQNQGFLVINNK